MTGRYVLAVALLLLLTAGSASSFQEEGLASWYGGKFQGRQTASGEIFDTNQFTAAHKTLPFGSIVRVTNLENGQSTVVRINDRGPFVAGRIIDLSRAAAADIGLAGQGLVRVRIEVLPAAAEDASAAGADRAEALYKIQVAAFRTKEYAERSLQDLEDAGFAAALEPTASGICRVVVRDVRQTELASTRRRLGEMGWADVITRRQE